MDVDTWSGQTGDAVELLTRLFPEGQTSAGYNVMVQWALAEESHVPVDRVETSVAVRLWERRFTSALSRLRQARVDVTDDVDTGVAEYVRLREGWEGPVVGVANRLGYTREQIDVSV